jgi:transcriptional regulator with XRE-family HTH domain
MRLREVALRLGVEFVWLGKVECHRTKPDADFVRRAAAFYGADEAELLALLDAWTEAPPIAVDKSICSGRRAR